MRPTYHLVAVEDWAAADDAQPYASASLAIEGFIHCTDGVAPLGVTFDRYYAADARPFLALTVDLDALAVLWRYDAQGSPYPHIYGSIARTAIVAVERVRRSPDGRFAGLDAA
jgi:uncharacterized protein (DUF952 family)